MPLTILVTGGAGYVGSHTTLELLIAGHSVICVDNLSNAYKDDTAALPEGLRRVQNITGQQVLVFLDWHRIWSELIKKFVLF